MSTTIAWEEECPNCGEQVSSDKSTSVPTLLGQMFSQLKVEYVCPECGCEFTAVYEWAEETEITVTKEGA